ncbi:hypothetical protein ACLOJK_040137 [Asimina triloba]
MALERERIAAPSWASRISEEITWPYCLFCVDDCEMEMCVMCVLLTLQILYNQTLEFEESTRNTEEIFNDALAIYRVCYNYAKTQGEAQRCGFAWKVAGHALCKLYAMRQNERSIVCLPSVLRELL